MTTPEGSLKVKVRQIFKDHRVHFLHIPGSVFGKGGAPDYIVCVNGMYLEVEVKARDGRGKQGKQTELQKAEQEKCFRAGGVYVVVNEDRLEALSRLIETMKALALRVDSIKVEKVFQE